MAENNGSEKVLHFPRDGRETYDEIKALQKMSREGMPPPPKTIEESMQQARQVILHGLVHVAENGINLNPEDDTHSK